MTLISTCLRQSKLDEALGHLSQLPKNRAGAIPPPVVSRLISTSGKAQRLNEVVDILKELNVKFETKMLDEVLSEALKRGDTLMCRHLYQLAASLSIPKSAQTYDMFIKSHASNASTVRTLFEEITADGSEVPLSESLALTFLTICSVNK